MFVQTVSPLQWLCKELTSKSLIGSLSYSYRKQIFFPRLYQGKEIQFNGIRPEVGRFHTLEWKTEYWDPRVTVRMRTLIN